MVFNVLQWWAAAPSKMLKIPMVSKRFRDVHKKSLEIPMKTNGFSLFCSGGRLPPPKTNGNQWFFTVLQWWVAAPSKNQ